MVVDWVGVGLLGEGVGSGAGAAHMEECRLDGLGVLVVVYSEGEGEHVIDVQNCDSAACCCGNTSCWLVVYS